MANELTTIAERIAKKSISMGADETKISNLEHQIQLYQNAAEKAKVTRDQKKEELEQLLDIQIKAVALVKERDALSRYTNGLREKFDAYEWEPEMPFEKKLESTDYHAKVAERFAVIDQLADLEKQANKIYYRR